MNKRSNSLLRWVCKVELSCWKLLRRKTAQLSCCIELIKCFYHRSWCPWSTSILKTTASTSYQHLQRFWVVGVTPPIKRRRWLQGEHSLWCKAQSGCIFLNAPHSSRNETLSFFPGFALFFPPVSFSRPHSIFCKMSALVRHRVSLFGKVPILKNTDSESLPSLHLSYFPLEQNLCLWIKEKWQRRPKQNIKCLVVCL